MRKLLRNAVSLAALIWPTLAAAHPFLSVDPLPPAGIPSGSTYNLVMEIFPGDTAVQSLQLDFELSSTAAFGPLSATLGDGFTLIYDVVNDPTHFSIVGDFTDAPLEEFGQFPVATISMEAGLAGETLNMLDSSVVVALEMGVPEEFPHEEFSAVRPGDEVAHVVPEPTSASMIAAGIAALSLLSRRRRARSAAR